MEDSKFIIWYYIVKLLCIYLVRLMRLMYFILFGKIMNKKLINVNMFLYFIY